MFYLTPISYFALPLLEDISPSTAFASSSAQKASLILCFFTCSPQTHPKVVDPDIMANMQMKHWLVCIIFILSIASGCWYWRTRQEPPKKPATSQVVLWDISKAPDSPWGSIREQNDVMVSLCQLVNLGYLSSYTPGSPQITLRHDNLQVQLTLGRHEARANGQKISLAIAPRLVSITPRWPRNSKPIMYPYMPLRPLAKLLNWSVTVGKSEVTASRSYRKTSGNYSYQMLQQQHIVKPSIQFDARVQVTPTFHITEFLPTSGYVAGPGYTVVAVGKTPVYTGAFAIFIQTADGEVGNRDYMGQSEAPMQDYYLHPGEHDGGLYGLFSMRNTYRVTRIIYHDGISCFSWDVK